MPEHQKVQKKSQKYKASKIKEGTCRKKVRQLQRRCGNQRGDRSERRAFSTAVGQKVGKNQMADAVMGAELRGLQAGEERRESNA